MRKEKEDKEKENFVPKIELKRCLDAGSGARHEETVELHEIHRGVEPRYDAHYPFPHFRRCDRLFEIWPRL